MYRKVEKQIVWEKNKHYERFYKAGYWTSSFPYESFYGVRNVSIACIKAVPIPKGGSIELGMFL
jgi:hypothetical protein